MCFHARFYFPSEPFNATNPEPQPQNPSEPSPNQPTVSQGVEERRFRASNGVVREVRLIHRLQQEALARLQHINCGNRQELGFPQSLYNTRPFILYLPNGEEYSIRITDPQTTSSTTFGMTAPNPFLSSCERSSIFRVEQVCGHTAVLRALKVVLNQYLATQSCVTVNLNDFVGIQTLNDAFVPNLCG